MNDWRSAVEALHRVAEHANNRYTTLIAASGPAAEQAGTAAAAEQAAAVGQWCLVEVARLTAALEADTHIGKLLYEQVTDYPDHVNYAEMGAYARRLITEENTPS